MSTRVKQDISMGPNLQRLRNRAGFSQEAVIAKLALMGVTRISREILSKMELGKYSIRISVLLALKDLYAADFDDFFQGLCWSDLPMEEL